MANQNGRDPVSRQQTMDVLEELRRSASKAAAYLHDARAMTLEGDFIRHYLRDDLPAVMDDVAAVASQLGKYNDTRYEQSYSKQRKVSREVAEVKA